MPHFLCKRLINLNFLHNPFLKSFTTTPSPSFTIEYLVNSCGLSLETALSTSKKIQIEENKTQNPNSVLSFFRSTGFSQTQITKLIATRPLFLQCKVDKSLKPKIEFLREMGFSNSNIHELITSNPLIMRRHLDNHLKPSFDFLKSFVQTNDNAITTIMRFKLFLSSDVKGTLVPNVALLVNQGVPVSKISKFIMAHPFNLMLSTDRFIKIVENVNKLGLQPTSYKYLCTVRAIGSMSKLTWERKFDVFQSFGLSEKEIMVAFMREPFFLNCSVEKIKRGMDFFVNTMKMEPSVFCSEPRLLRYGLETRIIPRYSVLMVLKSKNLIKKDKKIIWLFTQTNKNFFDNYVTKYMDQVPDLMEVYTKPDLSRVMQL